MHEVMHLTRKAWQRKRSVGIHEYVQCPYCLLRGLVMPWLSMVGFVVGGFCYGGF